MCMFMNEIISQLFQEICEFLKQLQVEEKTVIMFGLPGPKTKVLRKANVFELLQNFRPK
jgi:hypothetical protein